jgi:hypothetical protein
MVVLSSEDVNWQRNTENTLPAEQILPELANYILENPLLHFNFLLVDIEQSVLGNGLPFVAPNLMWKIRVMDWFVIALNCEELMPLGEISPRQDCITFRVKLTTNELIDVGILF